MTGTGTPAAILLSRLRYLRSALEVLLLPLLRDRVLVLENEVDLFGRGPGGAQDGSATGVAKTTRTPPERRTIPSPDITVSREYRSPRKPRLQRGPGTGNREETVVYRASNHPPPGRLAAPHLSRDEPESNKVTRVRYTLAAHTS